MYFIPVNLRIIGVIAPIFICILCYVDDMWLDYCIHSRLLQTICIPVHPLIIQVVVRIFVCIPYYVDDMWLDYCIHSRLL